MNNKTNCSKAFGEAFKRACKQLGIKSSRLCCVMCMVMEEAAQQRKTELVLGEDTLKKYVYGGFSRVCYLDAYSEFVCVFEEAISRISIEYPKAGEFWKEHKGHILRDFDEIHRLAVKDF